MLFKKIQLLQNKILWHLLFWVSLYSFILWQETGFENGSENISQFFEVSIIFICAAVIIYINLFLCIKYFLKNKIGYFIGILFLYTIYINVLNHTLFANDIINPINHKKASAFAAQFFFSLYFLVLLLLSFAFWAATAADKKNKELAAAQLKMQQFENDKLTAEKKILQTQINPHFLYNTLNYFYSKALVVSPPLGDSILLLSDIMRYSLQLKENKYGMVLLQNEVDHIFNIIKINQYRFSNKLNINFFITGELATVCIAPLILITFIENAFKHAELLDAKEPLIIKLEIIKEENKIYFLIHNKQKKSPKEMGTGIGLDNAKRRLDFLYGSKYTMYIANEPEFYDASLLLPLYKDVAL